MSRKWRQVRVFTSNTGPHWYYEILHRLMPPWLVQQPNTDFFFSKYLVPLGGGDDADTDPAQLAQQQNFLQQTSQGQLHRSVRIRFVEPAAPANPIAPAVGLAVAAPPPPKETALRTLIDNLPLNFWKSDFLDYDIGNGLGDDRFSAFPPASVNEREKRGEMVASVLQANCKLVLTLFQANGGGFTFEQNSHFLNQVFETPLQSVGHMLANVWFNRTGESVDVWALDLRRNIGTKI